MGQTGMDAWLVEVVGPPQRVEGFPGPILEMQLDTFLYLFALPPLCAIQGWGSTFFASPPA